MAICFHCRGTHYDVQDGVVVGHQPSLISLVIFDKRGQPIGLEHPTEEQRSAAKHVTCPGSWKLPMVPKAVPA